MFTGAVFGNHYCKFLSLCITAPNAYTLSKNKDSPTYSLASRPKEPKKYVTPAPGKADF